MVVKEPSLTVMVTEAEPYWLAAGLRVAVRAVPLPPKLMLAAGKSVACGPPMTTMCWQPLASST